MKAQAWDGLAIHRVLTRNVLERLVSRFFPLRLSSSAYCAGGSCREITLTFRSQGPLYFAPNAECVKVFIRLNLDRLIKCNRYGAIETMLLDQAFGDLFRIRAWRLDHEFLGLLNVIFLPFVAGLPSWSAQSQPRCQPALPISPL